MRVTLAFRNSNDVRIVVTFSAPMDREQTEAAYQSEGVPSSDVTFTWNAESTQLTITPDAPLASRDGRRGETLPRLARFVLAPQCAR